MKRLQPQEPQRTDDPRATDKQRRATLAARLMAGLDEADKAMRKLRWQ